MQTVNKPANTRPQTQKPSELEIVQWRDVSSSTWRGSREGTGNSFLIFDDRPSDSPFVERIWRSRSERTGKVSLDRRLSLGNRRYKTRRQDLSHGAGTGDEATTADCPAHGEWFAIRFRLGTFMPLLRPADLRDRNDVTLPNATSRSFWLNGSMWEYPNFENAETFVKRLVHDGLIAEDRSVSAVLRGQPQALTTRTEQRRFLQVTGMTRGAIHQIERARYATTPYSNRSS
jgi:hypothetical protein